MRCLFSAALLVPCLAASAYDYCAKPGRPPVEERAFRSAAVDAKIDEVAASDRRKMEIITFYGGGAFGVGEAGGANQR